MKKIILCIAVALSTLCSARPHRPGFHHHRWHGPGPVFTLSAIGAGLTAAAIASAWARPVVPAPAVVPMPGRVWVPPVYETRPVYNAYGQIIGWQQVMVVPGYWR